MARIIYTLGELKGSIGNLTFQNNHSGKIVRQRPRVKSTSTIKQQESHQRLQLYLKAWQGLTDTQRDNWNSFASVHTKENKFGQLKKLTGENWFISVNISSGLYTGITFYDPPPYNLPQPVPSFEVIATDSDLYLTIADSFNWFLDSIILWTSLPCSKQKPSINQIRKYVLLQYTEPSQPIKFTNDWQNAVQLAWNPTLQFPNSNIFFCLQTVSKSSGITSPLLCKKINTKTVVEATDELIYYTI